MFKQLISTYNTKNTHNQQSKYLQQILNSSNLNNLDGLGLVKEIEEQYHEVIQIFRQHPQLSLEFLLSKLMVDDCIRLMNLNAEDEWEKPGYGLLRAIRDIISTCDPIKDKQFLQWFCKTYTRHGSYQHVLTHLHLLSSLHHHLLSDTFIPQFFADFINSSAICIQHYLKLKSQSPKFNLEYMEYGQIIVNSTEKWVMKCYIELLRNFRIPNTGTTVRIAVINAMCDIIGALIEIQRQGNIQDFVCEEILNQSFVYIKKLVNLQEFYHLYLNLLRQNKFNIPQKKIIIPEKYKTNQITFPKQAFAFVVFKFLKQSSHVYSYAQVVRYLFTIVNEFCPFDYQIKTDVEKMFSKYVSLQWENLDTFVQADIPLSILWLNLHHFKNNRNILYIDQITKIFERLYKKSPSTYVNSLKLLTEHPTQGFENQKLQMIGQKLLKLQSFHCNELKILFKVVDLSHLNESSESVWTEVVKRSSQNNDIKTYLQRLLATKQINPTFKQQLIKALNCN